MSAGRKVWSPSRTRNPALHRPGRRGRRCRPRRVRRGGRSRSRSFWTASELALHPPGFSPPPGCSPWTPRRGSARHGIVRHGPRDEAGQLQPEG